MNVSMHDFATPPRSVARPLSTLALLLLLLGAAGAPSLASALPVGPGFGSMPWLHGLWLADVHGDKVSHHKAAKKTKKHKKKHKKKGKKKPHGTSTGMTGGSWSGTGDGLQLEAGPLFPPPAGEDMPADAAQPDDTLGDSDQPAETPPASDPPGDTPPTGLEGGLPGVIEDGDTGFYYEDPLCCDLPQDEPPPPASLSRLSFDEPPPPGNFDVAIDRAVPEPRPLALLAIAMLGYFLAVRQRRYAALRGPR